MFSGGTYTEVARWLTNFVASHAKRENPRVEAMVDAAGPRHGVSYGVHLRLGEELWPPPPAPPVEINYAEVRDMRGSHAWCLALAGRVRALSRDLVAASSGSRKSA